MGLLSVLSVGNRGLAASQLAMDVAGQNISNADVEGYSRKRLNLTAAYRYDSEYGQMGFGVDVVNVVRLRSSSIEEQIRRQSHEVGYYEEIDNTLESVENIFTEPSETGLLKFIDQFFDSWQNLANNPSDMSARTMVRTNGQILTDVFHNIGSELQELSQTRNSEIDLRVQKINQLSQDIYNLNLEIAAVELGKDNANDSRDRRDLLLKELSKIIEVNSVENDLGQITVTTGGNIIISPVYYQKLETVTRSYKRNDGTETTNIGVRFADSKRVYEPISGQLKGLFDSRDIQIPEYEKRIDSIAKMLVEKVNEMHRQGYNLNGFSGIDFFDSEVTGSTDIRLSSAILDDLQNIAAATAGESLPGVANTLTANSTAMPQQLYRDPAIIPPMDARNIVQNTVQVQTTGPGSVTLQEGVDYFVDYVHGTFQMLHSGYDGRNLSVQFHYRTGGFKGPGDNSNAVAIAKLRTALTMSPDTSGTNTASFGDFYGATIGHLGLNRNQAESNLETRTFLVDQYESHQDAISGVSLDEEMADLIKFQHTYQAAARLISVTDKMLDVLLNM